MFKQKIALLFANHVVNRNKHWINNPLDFQQNVFKKLINQGKKTVYGKKHSFNQIETYQDFTDKVPISNYEDLRPYIEQVLEGKKNILWPGLPSYFSKTSGTTSGIKYIPLTKESVPYHLIAARDAILNYMNTTGKTKFIDGKQIFLQGSPHLTYQNKIAIGRLSGIVAHHYPWYLKRSRMPSWEVNCIEDWETKIDKIIEETEKEKMTIIAGIPPWVKMYFDRIVEKYNHSVGDHFKDFSLFIYGGVNYEPYRQSIEKLIGKKIDSIETYPASEGFIAYQDNPTQNDLLLLVNGGIFFEFIKLEDIDSPNPKRIWLKDVEIGVNYVLILSSNAGLWGYNLGDTIQFTSLNPYRIIVSGRVKHFISAFGEHVIGSEVEYALQEGLEKLGVKLEVNEFTVAPQVNPSKGLPLHQWYIEFNSKPSNVQRLEILIDQALQHKNLYYRDLVVGKIIRPLQIIEVQKDGFSHYMRSMGKQGGQNKVPRLSNNRVLADGLQPYIVNNQ